MVELEQRSRTREATNVRKVVILTTICASIAVMPAVSHSQTRDDEMGVIRLQSSGSVQASTELNVRLKAVFDLKDPPQGIYLPFHRKSNGSRPELTGKARMGIYGNALKHPFAGMGGGSGGTIPFVVGMTEPKAYVGTQIAQAKYLMRPLSYSGLSASSHLPLLRVVVYPQTPVWGVNGGHHVLNVVLANEDQSLVIQPVLLKPFGVNVTANKAVPLGGDMVAIMEESNRYGGMNAVFRLSDLERVRSMAADHSFYLMIVGSDSAKQLYKVDPSYFEQLGD